MNYFTSFFSGLFIFICFQIKAQQNYSKLYSNGNVFNNIHLYSKSVIAAPDNGCLIVGQTNTTGILIRVDSLGNVIWNKTLSPPVEICDIVAGVDTSYYLIGKRFDSVSNYVNLIKFNFHGGVVWSRKIQYASYQTLQPLSVQGTIDSGLVFCGNTLDSTQKSFVTKVDKNGNINWSSIIQVDNSSTIFCSMSQTPDSGFVMTGSINQTKGSILKLTKAGTVSWCKTYFGNDLINRSGKDILVHHNKLYAYFSFYDPLLIILDLSGNIILAKEYNLASFGNYNVYSSYKLNKTLGGGFFMTHEDSYPGAIFLKTDSLGNLNWYNKIYVGSALAAAQVRDKGYVLIGNGPTMAAKLSSGVAGIGLTKLDSLGNGHCSSKYNFNVVNVPFNVTSETYTQTLIGSSQVFSIGLTSISIGTGNGCLAIYGGIHEFSNSDQFSIFPNPTSQNISIQYKEKINDPVKYTIINLSGQILFEKTSSSQEETQVLDCSSLPPSVYILKISSKGKVIGNKQLIITP